MIESTASASTITSEVIELGEVTGLSIQVSAVECCLSAAAFTACDVSAACDTITEASHGYETGLKGQFATSCGLCDVLPAGLSTCTDYFVIDVDDCTFAVATSRALAVAGTKVNITDGGVGCHTFTPAAADCTSGTITVTYSNDGTTFVADACAGLAQQVITACTLSAVDNADGIHYKQARVEVDITDSQWTIDVDVNGKG